VAVTLEAVVLGAGGVVGIALATLLEHRNKARPTRASYAAGFVSMVLFSFAVFSTRATSVSSLVPLVIRAFAGLWWVWGRSRVEYGKRQGTWPGGRTTDAAGRDLGPVRPAPIDVRHLLGTVVVALLVVVVFLTARLAGTDAAYPPAFAIGLSVLVATIGSTVAASTTLAGAALLGAAVGVSSAAVVSLAEVVVPAFPPLPVLVPIAFGVVDGLLTFVGFRRSGQTNEAGKSS
jgi:hypothetical protein